MSDCIFCSIVTGDSPAYRIYEDENTLAFLDVEPATRGHTLVLPKNHYETVTDIPKNIVGEVFETVQRVADALEAAYEPDGINVVQSNGSTAGQEIFHAHTHVIPRYEQDKVTLQWTTEDIEDGAQQGIAATIRDELNGTL